MKTIVSLKSAMIFFVCLLATSLAMGTSPRAASSRGQLTAKKLGKSEVLQKAHDANYTLQQQGLKNFQVNIEPNWKQFIEDMKKTMAVSEEKMAALSLVQCTVAVNNAGEATVTPYSADGKEINHIVDDSVGGFKQMVQGFYQTWDAMVFTSVFPDPDDTTFTMTEQADGYIFTGSGPTEGQEFILNKTFQLTSMKVLSGSTTVLMRPKFTKIDKGLLLTGIDSDINSGAQQISIQIQYQPVGGFQLPSHAWFKITMPNQAAILVDMGFNKYEVNKP
jgi:hypothetical protein